MILLLKKYFWYLVIIIIFILGIGFWEEIIMLWIFFFNDKRDPDDSTSLIITPKDENITNNERANGFGLKTWFELTTMKNLLEYELANYLKTHQNELNDSFIVEYNKKIEELDHEINKRLEKIPTELLFFSFIGIVASGSFLIIKFLIQC